MPAVLGETTTGPVAADIPLGGGHGLPMTHQYEARTRCWFLDAHDTFTGGWFSTEFQKASSGVATMRAYTAGG
ncbi:unannotated protein [freshwater metagenome]|uniref:Unannotated protein n=1 Tax=freshwater metagenome TaxID=449393 RepID=A0A6J7A142_9ZZZZ